LLFTAALLTASVAAATDNNPAFEAFLGYNFVHFDPSTTLIPSFNLNGGDAQFAFNFMHSVHSVGLVLDVGAVTSGTSLGTLTGITPNHNIDHTVVNLVLGPRYTFHGHSRLSPFVQALFGGARAHSSTSITLLQGGTVWPPPGLNVPPQFVTQPLTATLETDRTGFAMILGGGLDIKVSKHVSFRPIGADYYFTRLPSFVNGNDTNKNHFRYSAGVNFLFGGER
jgi:hypothetical protein